jgi:hypothetical protein
MARLRQEPDEVLPDLPVRPRDEYPHRLILVKALWYKISSSKNNLTKPSPVYLCKRVAAFRSAGV